MMMASGQELVVVRVGPQVQTGMAADIPTQGQTTTETPATNNSTVQPVVTESLDSGADLGCSWECDSGTASDEDDADETLEVEHLEKALDDCQLERPQQLSASHNAAFKIPRPSLSTTSPVYSSGSRQLRVAQSGPGDTSTHNTQAKKNLSNIWTSEDSCSSDISEPYSFDGDVESSTSTEVGEELELLKYHQPLSFNSDLSSYVSQFLSQKTSTTDTANAGKAKAKDSGMQAQALRVVGVGPVIAQSSALPTRQSQCVMTSPRSFFTQVSSQQRSSTTPCSVVSSSNNNSKLLSVLKPVSSRPQAPVNSLKRQLIPEEVSSEDEEICALLGAEAASDKSRPLCASSISKVHTPIPEHSPARSTLRSTPRKRHRSSQDDCDDRPFLNFDKMQKTVLHSRGEPGTTSKPPGVQVVHVQTRGSRKEASASVVYDPSRFAFRTISQQCCTLPPVETPLNSP